MALPNIINDIINLEKTIPNLLDKTTGGDCRNMKISTIGSQYYNESMGEKWAINLNNSDVVGINGLWWSDSSQNQDEGIQFPNSNIENGWSTFRIYNENMIYTPRRPLGGSGEDYIVDYIVASGTNYIRYASGIQICWGRLEETKSLSASWGGGVEGVLSSSITFPVAFSSAPSASVQNLNGNGLFVEMMGVSTTSITSIAVWRPTGAGTYTSRLSWLAIGRWK